MCCYGDTVAGEASNIVQERGLGSQADTHSGSTLHRAEIFRRGAFLIP